jgi:hypothetical protein
MNSRLASSLSAPPASLRRYAARGVRSAAARNSDKRTRILACSAGDNWVFGAGEPLEPVSGASRLTGAGNRKSGGAAGRVVESGNNSGAPCGSGVPEAAGNASDFSSFGEGDGCCAAAYPIAKAMNQVTRTKDRIQIGFPWSVSGADAGPSLLTMSVSPPIRPPKEAREPSGSSPRSAFRSKGVNSGSGTNGGLKRSRKTFNGNLQLEIGPIFRLKGLR